MHRVTKRATALAATVATVGFSSLFMAAPAYAAPVSCDNGATLIAPNVCELKLTAVGTTTFIPQANMGQLEMLLVGGGAAGNFDNVGYGGGGGEVTLVDFSADTTTPIAVAVGAAEAASTATQGAAQPLQARPGDEESSGNGNTSDTGNPGTGGGGAGAPAVGANGGAGLTGAGAAAAAGMSASLFANDMNCYGGGGAYGNVGGSVGTATCGGGTVTDDGVTSVLVAPAPNSGGGGSVSPDAIPTITAGASGIVVVRWSVLQDVTVTFETNGRGAAIPAQTFFEGGTATPPAAPTATDYTFGGWFTDAALTTPADFTVPITASTTFYAAWAAVTTPDATTPDATTPAAITPARTLPPTGAEIDALVLSLGLGALGLGLGLTLLAKRRTRGAN